MLEPLTWKRLAPESLQEPKLANEKGAVPNYDGLNQAIKGVICHTLEAVMDGLSDGLHEGTHQFLVSMECCYLVRCEYSHIPTLFQPKPPIPFVMLPDGGRPVYGAGVMEQVNGPNCL